MESQQALVAHNATTEDLERKVNELLCPKEFSVKAHEKREEIFQELQRKCQIEQFNLAKNPNNQWRDQLLTRNRRNAIVTRPLFARGGTKLVDLNTAAEEEETAMIALPSSSLQSQANNADADEEEETAIIALPSSSLQIQADNADEEEKIYVLEEEPQEANILSSAQQESLLVALNCSVKTTISNILATTT
jgi:hypothetical protein